MNLQKFSTSERVRLQALPILFGLGVMSTVPRTADLKENLGLANGAFGTVLSFGAVGSLISLFVIGTLVHKLTVRKSLHLFALLTYGLMLSWPHIHNPVIFFVANMTMAFSWSGYNISILTHGLARQKQTGQSLLGLIHGGWSIGVLITTLFALWATSKLSFAVHIDLVMSLVLIASQILIYSLKDTFAAHEDEQVPEIKINLKTVFTNMTFDKTLNLAFILGTIMEYTSNDWVTLLAHQELGFSKAHSVIPYLVFIIMMIVGRVFLNKIVRIRPERFWLIIASQVGSLGFMALLHLTFFLQGRVGQNVLLALFCLSFACAGFGTSFMAAIMMNAGIRRNHLAASTIMARMNFSNVILAFVAKLLFAWVAQSFSILAAFTIPALMLFGVTFLNYIASPRLASAK